MHSEDENKKTGRKTSPPSREIGNAGLFADDIIFSDTEKILFEEDLNEKSTAHTAMMDGNPEERYTASKKLNQGGMKAIWEVDDHRTARKVAMALIQDSRIASVDDIDSFLYEARLTANLQHPNIIPIYDIALDENGNPYFTMKALKGETLGDIIKQLRAGNPEYLARFSRTRLLGIFLKVCNAIDYAHTKGVIHLDLKPSNVNIGDFGEVHVLDWGLSTLITHLNEYDGEPVSWQSIDDVSLEDGQTLTRYLEKTAKRRELKNVVGGTPGYMSPEQAQGMPSDIDFQTDVYMLGAMLYEILTYHCPIEGGTVKESLQRTVRGDFPPPGDRAPELRIPPALAAIAMKAMATEPTDRYANVAALIRDIHQYQDGFATSAENPTFITHAALLVKRHKLAVGLITTTAAIIALVLFQSFRSIKKSEKVALDALGELRIKNEYIASTAKKVAPDYLKLTAEQEKNLDFEAADQALDTGLAFDPMLEMGWLWKARFLLARQEFSKAWKLLSGQEGHPVWWNDSIRTLGEKYKDRAPLPDAELPQLVRDFMEYNPAGLPRLFHHLNRQPFNPETRFPALAESLKLLNPEIGTLHFNWKPSNAGGWIIDLSGNPKLDDITPLCGLDIRGLNANTTGTLDLFLLTQAQLSNLSLSGARINHLPDIKPLANLRMLDLSHTSIRNLSSLIKASKLTTLNISGIENLSLSEQLIWNRNLKMLTVSATFRNDPTLKLLARRGVIIIYTDH